MMILAIDPGASGGLAWHDGNFVHALPMPDTEGDVLNKLRELSASGYRTAYVEQVGGFIKGNPAPGSTMFNFGRGYGFILGVLMATGVRVVLVRPQQWQKHFSLGTVKDAGGKTPWKNKCKALAQRLRPGCDITLKTADAVLILEYGKSHHTT